LNLKNIIFIIITLWLHNITKFVRIREWIENEKEAEVALDIKNRAALRAAIRRLQVKNELVEPAQDFHLIIPPPYRESGCLPAIYFISL